MGQKVGGGLRSLKALEFEKWGLESISPAEVYAHGSGRIWKRLYAYICTDIGPDPCPTAWSLYSSYIVVTYILAYLTYLHAGVYVCCVRCHCS